MTRRERLILLNMIPEAGPACLKRLMTAFGGLERLWSASVSELQGVEGIGPALAARLAACRSDEAGLREELRRAERAGVKILTLEDDAYPALLRTIHDPPLVLYVRGTWTSEDACAVALVGARRASVYGLQCAERLGYDLALRGITVVSGMARGIDAAAHRGALQARGRTVAVLGSGLQRVYPREHEALAAEIAKQGAVLSEYPLQTPPLPHYFPRRNRVISGLSLGVVVVEAAARSGALITVESALEQGREVFAVPGPMTAVTSYGTHQLLKQGARLVTSVEDILEELRLHPRPAEPAPVVPSAAEEVPDRFEDAMERRVLECVEAAEQPIAIDRIAAHSGLAVGRVSAALLQLELRRAVRQLPGKRFASPEPSAR